jgi:glycosyltransferase involved in cell wall biosynthesis
VSDERETILVYRDRLVPRSEVHFLRRVYMGFERLKPVWIGRHPDEGLCDLGVSATMLGRPGLLGPIDRERFKHFGTLPPAPDLRAIAPRLVHAHFGRGGALALPIARQLGVPLVVHYHGGDATKETHYRRGVLPTIYQQRLVALQREAALFVCVSNFIRERLLARGFPAEKLVVHPLGVEIGDEERDAASLAPREPIILFAGRFVEKKGIGVLIEAVRRLGQDGRAVRLELVGDGPLVAEAKRQATGLRDIAFLGWLPNAELRARMQRALAVCVPSVEAAGGDSEGLPMVVLEAMASGAPVVATDHAGIAEAVQDGSTGLLVAPGDVDALAAALRRIVDAPDIAQAMGRAGRLAAKEHFNGTLQSRRLEQILLDVIGAGHRVGAA